MLIGMIKEPGGVFRPVTDMEQEKTTKFKTGELYTAEIKLTRNPAFHRKVFAFFNFCFDHWNGGNAHEFCSEAEQFDRFRKDLTILAGFYIQSVRLDGTLRTEAKSLSFGQMKQEEFEQCYTALINAAVKHIFRGCDPSVENTLLGFF